MDNVGDPQTIKVHLKKSKSDQLHVCKKVDVYIGMTDAQ